MWEGRVCLCGCVIVCFHALIVTPRLDTGRSPFLFQIHSRKIQATFASSSFLSPYHVIIILKAHDPSLRITRRQVIRWQQYFEMSTNKPTQTNNCAIYEATRSASTSRKPTSSTSRAPKSRHSYYNEDFINEMHVCATLLLSHNNVVVLLHSFLIFWHCCQSHVIPLCSSTHTPHTRTYPRIPTKRSQTDSLSLSHTHTSF